MFFARLLGLRCALLAVLGFWLGGCASMVGTDKQEIELLSVPNKVQVFILNSEGAEVYRGATPARVELIKSDGSQFGRQDYVVVFYKKGYEPQAKRLKAYPQASTYLLGNLAIAGAAAVSSAGAGLAVGLAAWVFVDPASGKMYEIAPGSITARLQSKGGVGEDEQKLARLRELQ